MNAHGQSIRYVDADAPAGGDGFTWATAFNDLQDALAPGSGAEEIWVASGTYKPSDRDVAAVFEMRSGLAVYGGFRGDEMLREQRDPEQNITTLSGDLFDNDAPGFTERWDNTVHIVVIRNTDQSAVLDGFRIQGGHADGTALDDQSGGGILIVNASPTIADCRIEDCHADQRGGGIAVIGGAPKLIGVTVSGCEVFGGQTPMLGGGLFLDASDASLDHCRLELNWSRTLGGGVAIAGGAPEFLALELVENDAAQYGGGMYAGPMAPRSLTLEGGEFSLNTAQQGGAIYVEGPTLAVNEVRFHRNAADVGSAVHVAGGRFVSARSVWERNGADETGAPLQRHAALAVTGGEARLSGDRFIGNQGEHDGGAISQDAGVVVCRDVEFLENGAESGAAVWQWAGTLDLARCALMRNVARGGGGAVHSANEGVVRIFNSRLVGNQARVGGAAILRDATIANSALVANTAVDGSGGAVYTEGTVSIHNCTIAFNVAGTTGGGIRRGDSSTPGPLRVANTVLWGNQSADVGLEPRQISVRSYAPSDLAIDSCIVQGWRDHLPGVATFGDDPRFVDEIGPDGIERSGDEDVRLAAGSPGRDAGANDLIAPDLVDLDGDGDTSEPAPMALDDAARRLDDGSAPDVGLGAAPLVDIGAWEHDTPLCRADMDGSGSLDFFDFLTFQSLFAAGDPRADFTGDGVLDFFDFLVFQDDFAAGCP